MDKIQYVRKKWRTLLTAWVRMSIYGRKVEVLLSCLLKSLKDKQANKILCLFILGVIHTHTPTHTHTSSHTYIFTLYIHTHPNTYTHLYPYIISVLSRACQYGESQSERRTHVIPLYLRRNRLITQNPLLDWIHNIISCLCE